MREQLLNGAFTGAFSPFRQDKTLITAVGWAPWYLSPQPDDPDWKKRQPVFSAADLDGPVQQLSTPFGTHVAGLWQQVPAAAGNQYEFSADGQAWSSEAAEPGSKLEASDVNLQIGIDPTGGLDPESPLIIWSDVRQPLSEWQTVHVSATAETAIITVYLKSAPALPKRQQTVFWRNAQLRPMGHLKRSVNIIGPGDTHIKLEPEEPKPGQRVTAVVSANRPHEFTDLLLTTPAEKPGMVRFLHKTLLDERTVWRYEFVADTDGLYELRFAGDDGARLLSLRLLQVARDVQLVPSSARLSYKRVYVLLPPTADEKWLLAAARGSFDGRFTIGFSADDAGIGDLGERQVLAVNPHHWPDVLTARWFQQHYPGAHFTAVVANSPTDLEVWLKEWIE